MPRELKPNSGASQRMKHCPLPGGRLGHSGCGRFDW